MDIEKLRQEYKGLAKELENPELISNWQRFQEISKRRKELEKVVSKAEELEEVKARLEENQHILAAQEEPELQALASQEMAELANREAGIQKELEEFARQERGETPGGLILELRPGTGGEEAALFASDLWQMYERFAERRRWKMTLLHVSETELGGIKEASLEIEGKDAFPSLRYEGGVHRVQRIPGTEKQGRVHTSTVSVAVLPKPKKEEFQLNPADLHMEFTTSSGPGGQNVNKRQTAVRLTHKPTGLTVTAETARTQQANKEFALALLQAKLAEQQRLEQEQELAGKRRAQIGTAERAEKIRTYNFPQDRITDHRIKKSWHGIEKILREGNLDPIVEALNEM